MKLRFLAALFAMAAVAAPALPRTGAAAQATHVLRYSDALDVTNLNPDFATSANATDLAQLTMGYLTRTDTHANPVPELATVVPTVTNGGISRDGKTITWHLRRNVKWSDGKPFDADDVVFSAAVVQNPTNNVTVREGWDIVRRIDEPDKYTVVFHLSRPNVSYFEDYFGSDGSVAILPKHLLGGLPNINQAPYNALPVGIGPFRYTAYHRGDSVEMEANPYYFRGRPKLDRIVYRIITDDNTLLTQLQTGELDLWANVSGTVATRVQALPGTRSRVMPSQFTSVVALNVAHPVLRDVRVRRALRFATDSDTIFDKVNHRLGVREESFMPVVTRGYAKLPLVRFDLGAANALLDRAGWRPRPDGIRSKDGRPLVIDVAIPAGNTPSEFSAELLRETWLKAGVKLDLHVYSSTQFFAPYADGGILYAGKYDAALFSTGGNINADSHANLGCDSIPPNGFNFSHYCNRDFDAAVARYASTFDPAVQAAAAKRAQLLVDEDVPLIVLYERSFLYTSDARLTNFHPKPFGTFDDFMNVDN